MSSTQYLNRRLIAAVHGGDLEKASELLALGANPNCRSGFHSPLTLAASENHPELVRALVESGARIDMPVKGSAPIHWAAGFSEQAFNALLELSADTSIRTSETLSTPAHIAAQAGNAFALQRLGDMGAPLELPDATGAYPIHIAAALSKPDAVQALLEAGARPESRDLAGKTALHLAAPAPAAALVKAGADLRALDAQGLEPIETCPLPSRNILRAARAQITSAEPQRLTRAPTQGKTLGS